jgi:hypothetical protein
MFGKKVKKTEQERAAYSGTQDVIDLVLKIEDAGERYDALGRLSAGLAAEKKTHDDHSPNGGSELAYGTLLASGSIPAFFGTASFLKAFFIADMAVSGGVLSAGVLLLGGVIACCKSDDVRNQKRKTIEKYDSSLTQIHPAEFRS